MVLIHDWIGNLQYKVIDLALDWRTQSPGRSLTGAEQINLTQSEVWTCDIKFPTLRFAKGDYSWTREYRAWISRIQGRYGVFKLPIYDGWFGYGEATFGLFEGHGSAGQPFSDGTYWYGDAGFDQLLQLTDVVVNTALQGVTEVVLNFGDYGEFLEKGHYFTLDTYLYIVDQIWYDDNGDAYIMINPPLRAGLTLDAPFDWPPYLVCHLAEDLTGRHELDFGMFMAPQISVEEYVDRD